MLALIYRAKVTLSFRPYCQHGPCLDKPSAFSCFLLGRCCMSNWYSDNASIHRANRPSGSLKFSSYCSEKWSERMANFYPHKYGQKSCCKELLGSMANKKPSGLPCIRPMLITLERGGAVQFQSAITRYIFCTCKHLELGFGADFSISTPANAINRPSAVNAGIL